MGKFDALAEALGLAVKKYGDDAAKILEKVDTPELAVSLKGKARGDYLKALDEIYGPTEKRAAEMGFGPETYYHGTGRDFEKFDPKFHGSHTGPGLTKDRFWFTDNPETAEIFSSSSAKLDVSRKAYEKEDQLLRRQGDVYNELKSSIPKDFNLKKLFNTPENQLNVFKKYGDLNENQINLIKEYNQLEELMAPIENQRKQAMKESSGALLPVRLKLPKNLPEKDMGGKFWSESASEIPEGAIKLKNFRESTPLENAPSATSIGLQNPLRIRSEFAAFDPRFKDSSLLMAGALAAPMSQMEEKPSFNPLETLKEGAKVGLQGVRKASEAWEEMKRPYAEALGRQFNIAGATPEVEKLMQEIGNIALDPLNMIGGAPGAAIGLLQTASQFAPKSPEEEALTRVRAGRK